MKKSTKRNIALSTAALSAIALSATALVSINQTQQHSINATIANDDKVATYGITDNSNPTDLLNPDEVYYITEDLTRLNVWNEDTQNPANGSLNTENAKKFKNLRDAVESIYGSSPAKAKLLKLCDDVYKFIYFKEYEQLTLSNDKFAPLWAIVKQELLTNLGISDQFSQIENLANTAVLFKELSGIASGQKIKLFSSKSLKQYDLLAGTAGEVAANGGGSTVLGSNYTYMAKIATIDLSTSGNYVLNFNYRKTPGARPAKGSLIIRNLNGELAAKTIEEIKNSVDIFGRYDGQFTFGTGSYDKILNNFVFAKNGSQLSLMLRVNGQEQFESLEFVNNSEYAQPTEFGILDVQATETATFNTLIDAQTANVTGGKLVDINDSANVLTATQFFSKTIKTTKIAQPTETRNRKLEFYQGAEELSLGLNYALNTSLENIYSYAPLHQWKNSQDTGTQILINLNFDGTTPNTFPAATYDFYMPLLENMPADTKAGFPQNSKIELISEVSSQAKIAKQTLNFNDHFYGIGSRPSWANVPITDSYDILISDITQKIFFEQPDVFAQAPAAKVNATQTSYLSAKEQSDTRSEVIQMFAQIYQNWSQTNSGVFNGVNYSFKTNKLTASNKNGHYSNIKVASETISGSGNAIYKNLNNYWTLVKSVINQLFDSNTVFKNRYEITGENLALNIVNGYFINSSQFTLNSANLDQELNAAITLWSDFVSKSQDPSQVVPNIAQLPKELVVKLSNHLLNLVSFQYETILNEFNSYQIAPLYNLFEAAFNDTKTQQLYSVNAPETFLQIVQPQALAANLIQYKPNGWNNIGTSKQTTLKDAFKSFIDLLYYGDKTPTGTLIGDALFVNGYPSSAFRSLTPETLLTFNPTATQEQKNQQISVMASILSFFGYDLVQDFSKMFITGNKLSLGFDINQALRTILSNICSQTPSRKSILPNSSTVNSYYLDDLIAGANAISALNWKLQSLNSSPAAYAKAAATNGTLNQQLITNINAILTQQQASSTELAIWSNIVNGDYNFETSYSSSLSGRDGLDKQTSVYNKIISDEALLKNRTTLINKALQSITQYLKYIWFPVIALIGVGILTTSAYGMASKSKSIKLSSRPALKALLITGVVIGFVIATVAIIIGVLAL